MALLNSLLRVSQGYSQSVCKGVFFVVVVVVVVVSLCF